MRDRARGSGPSSARERLGRYQLEALLGRGSCWEVFRGKSFGVEGFEKTLVVKRLLPELCERPGFVEAFLAEARNAIRLSHANVAQVFDLGRVETSRGITYFTAGELVAGLDLATAVARVRERGSAPDVGFAIYVGAECAKALDHAHRQSSGVVVHADLRPGNVLLSWDGEIKVSDFGVARPLHALAASDPSHTHRVSERLSHASPELLLGKALNPASDLFSLGALIYELACGRPAFPGADPAAVRRAVIADEPPQLGSVAPAALALEPLVHRCLAKDPARRFARASQLYEELIALAYASGHRFDAGDLADLLDDVREVAASPPAELIESVLERSHSGSGEMRAVALPATAAVEAPAPEALRRLGESSGRRELAVLVLDARDGSLQHVLERARGVALRYGGRELQAEADEVAFVFGLDSADGRDSEHAVRAALVLVRNLGFSAPGAGVASGPVAIVEDAVASGPERDALLAAARSAVIDSGRVGVTSAVAHSLQRVFAMAPVPSNAAVHLVEDAPRRAVPRRFVGRRTELRRLAGWLSTASRRKLVVAAVFGSHGAGKSRLLDEAVRRLERGALDVGVIVARCPPRGADVPFSALAALLRTACGVRDGDPPDRIAAVEPNLRALGLLDEEVRSVISLLGIVPGATTNPAVLPGALARMIASLCSERPHVFAFDDAHAMDDASAGAVVLAVERLPQARALLLFSGRAREMSPLRKIPGHHEMTLGDLDPPDVARLVAAVLGVDDVPVPLLEFVRARAGGHPMFVEELVLEAVESRAVVVRGRVVRQMELGGHLSVPRSLRALLGARLGRLPEAERGLMIASAVLGAPVDLSVLSAMLDVPLGEVTRLAASLEQRGLLTSEGPVEIGFGTPLASEVLLAELDPELRVELHARAANAYRVVLGPRTEELAAMVGMHLAEAGESDRAAGFYATSGLFHLDARRLDVAARHLIRALELAELPARGAGELAEWISALSMAVRHVRSGSSLPALVQKLSGYLLLAKDVEPRARAQMTIDLALSLGALHRYKEARRLLQRAAETASHWPELSRAALTAEAELANRQGDFKTALAALERARALGPGGATEQHRLCIAAAQAMAGAGRLDDALSELDHAEQLTEVEDLVSRGERDKVRALIMGFRGAWAACALLCEQAAELMREAGLKHEVAVNLHNQGDALLRSGDLPRAYATLKNSLALAEEIGSERLVNLNALMLAYLDALAGSNDAAQALGTRLARADAQKWTWDVTTGRYLLGKLHAAKGDASGARRELALARSMALAADNRVLAEDCALELSKL